MRQFTIEYWNSECAAHTREITIEASTEQEAKVKVAELYGITRIENIIEKPNSEK